MNKQPLRLGHSPDADDAFMFYALAHGKIDTGGLTFEHILTDIETLNQWAREPRLEISAVSVHGFAYCHTHYAMLTHGGSFGRNYGPLVVAREAVSLESLAGKRIAIPGLLTSAFLTLRLRLPEFEPIVMPFDRIMDAVLAGEADAGLVIHEGQLTHETMGLRKIEDLGVWWQEQTGLPLPLGVNVVRKDLGADMMARLSGILRESVAYGLQHREEALAYALSFGRGLEPSLADRFVGMYVNDLTLELNQETRSSIELLLRRGSERGIIPPIGQIDFVS
ncbi:MAG: ABC transporter substrate-binding protein [Chloroflexota bacterium]|nr:MAG: ABC transporter substrate-binding protein [Chloroflexota bacterium]